jgi:hypothetical protein
VVVRNHLARDLQAHQSAWSKMTPPDKMAELQKAIWKVVNQFLIVVIWMELSIIILMWWEMLAR